MSFFSKRMSGKEMARSDANAAIVMDGNWEGKMADRLENILARSVQITGKTGEQTLQRAMITMSKTLAGAGSGSTEALTPIAPARRLVEPNPRFAHLLRKKQYKAQMIKNPSLRYRYFKFRSWKLTQESRGMRELFSNYLTRPPAKQRDIGKIGNRGLARRSWMWGLGAFGVSTARAGIPGVATLAGVVEGRMAGYVKENRLAYVEGILPGGWEKEAERRAGAIIMHTDARRLETAWLGAALRDEKTAMRNLDAFIKRVSA
jgi:hypothetical protein